MDLLFLIFNLVECFVWTLCGVILLSLKQGPPSAFDRSFRVAKRYVALTLFFGSMSIISTLLFGRYHSGQIEILNIYSLFFFYLGVVFVLMAFVNLYNCKDLSSRLLLWALGPISVLFLLYLLACWIWGSPDIYTYNEFRLLARSSPPLILRTLLLLSVLGGIIVVVVRFVRARRIYQAMLNNYFSGEQERERSRWIDRTFLVVLVSFITAVISYLSPSFWWDLVYGIYFTILSVWITVLFVNYQRQALRVAAAAEFALRPEADVAGRSDSAVGIQLVRWSTCAEKPYLTPGLSLEDLSQATGVSRSRLSAHINSRFGMSFNAWITSLRVREVERLLADPMCTKSLSEIALLTGFSDLAAMNSSFKRLRGISPSALRRRS